MKIDQEKYVGQLNDQHGRELENLEERLQKSFREKQQQRPQPQLISVKPTRSAGPIGEDGSLTAPESGSCEFGPEWWQRGFKPCNEAN